MVNIYASASSVYTRKSLLNNSTELIHFLRQLHLTNSYPIFVFISSLFMF